MRKCSDRAEEIVFGLLLQGASRRPAGDVQVLFQGREERTRIAGMNCLFLFIPSSGFSVFRFIQMRDAERIWKNQASGELVSSLEAPNLPFGYAQQNLIPLTAF